MTDSRKLLTGLRPIILCADDFALSEGVSDAILRLAHERRLSAIGCMTVSPLWPAHARLLHGLECDIGLHLTLTDHEPMGELPYLAPNRRLPSLHRLMVAAYARRLDAREIREEVRLQCEAFVSEVGRPPDFIDGHQHVHLMPRVRGIVLDLTTALAPRPYLRVCWEPPHRVLARGVAVGKASLLSVLSAPLRREAARRGLAANDSFRGVHAFDPAVSYARLFPRFLTGHARCPLIMCHPGFPDSRLRAIDPVSDERLSEYEYFASAGFLNDLGAADSRLARFSDIHKPFSGVGAARMAL